MRLEALQVSVADISPGLAHISLLGECCAAKRVRARPLAARRITAPQAKPLCNHLS
jgi:hypothetical protein